MRLLTENGEFGLPSDFAITINRTNPMLSTEGDASYPVTLPPTVENLALAGHPERIDNATTLSRKVQATLTEGAYEKHGQLVIDSAHRSDGITAVFAIDESDLYAAAKAKTLKEIFEEYDNGNGYVERFATVEAACRKMAHLYGGDEPPTDYVVFPVAVAPYEDDGETTYQYNNEINGDGALVYGQRTVREGDELVCVPEGYGVSPFLLLHRMIDLLFECLGYTVAYNFFAQSPWSSIAVVNNCSDALVTATLRYADMAPSCTLSEFLSWLEAKFHVFVVADSDLKEVRVQSVEDVLSGAPDQDLTDVAEGDPTVSRSPTRRVVLTPNNTIEGTEPVTETLDALTKKYGPYRRLNETQYDAMTADNATFYGSLMLRESTGVFYEQCLDLDTGKPALRAAGTNHFTYDRSNADEEEAYSQSDVMPLMLCEGESHKVAPFIGDRIHFHTAYKDKEEKSSQGIIIAWHLTSTLLGYKTTGTTQQELPYSNGNTYSFHCGLTNESLFQRFWARYNTILLNGEVRVKQRLLMGATAFKNLQMAAVKLMNGQPMLPEKASATLTRGIGPVEAEFVIVKCFENQTEDRGLLQVTDQGLEWRLDYASDLDAAASECVPTASRAETLSAKFHQKTVFVGPPLQRGETRTVTAVADLLVRWTNDQRNYVEEWYEDRVVTIHLRCPS